MSYFPAECFDLIKDFADINGARYHHREVARMIKSNLAYCQRTDLPGSSTPLVYKILFAEERLEDMRVQANTSGVGHTYLFWPMQDLREERDDLKFNQAWAMHLIQWEKTQTRPQPEMLWLKLTTKPDPPCETDDVSLDPTGSNSCYNVFVNELEKFCMENQIPQNQYANLNKQELISLILKYNFD